MRKLRFRKIALATITMMAMVIVAACYNHPRQETEGPVASAIPQEALAAALQAVAVDSLCRRPCPVVILDTVIRGAQSLLPYYPSRNTPVQHWGGGGRPGSIARDHKVVPSGSWLLDPPGSDTAEMALYIVGQSQPIPQAPLLGIAFLAPGGYLTTVAVHLRMVGRRWIVDSTYTFFEL